MLTELKLILSHKSDPKKLMDGRRRCIQFIGEKAREASNRGTELKAYSLKDKYNRGT